MPEHDSRKNKITILIISSILSLIFFSLCFINPDFQITAINLIIVFFIGVWIFFSLPSYRWMIFRYDGKMIPKAFKFNLSLGLIIILFYFFALPLYIAPYYGLKYYFFDHKKPTIDK
jgi:NADH:ubiquinone oxidoreductase subunit 6 (subunit J)